MGKANPVPRSPKKSEFTLTFGSTSAKRGWRDLVATYRNPMADAWDFLTRTPTTRTPTNYPLVGSLSTITRDGRTHQRWQHKPTLKGSARLWFYVENRTVVLEQVHTAHPKETL